MGRPAKTTIKAATEQYLIDRSDYHRDRLIELLMPWIRVVARQVKGKYFTKLEAEDLEQAGAMGLVKALLRFDGRVAIQTFLALRVKGAMIDACREDSIIPRLVQRDIGRILFAERDLIQLLGRKPTEAELEAASKLTPEQFATAQRFRTHFHHVSVTPTYRQNDEDEVEMPVAIDPTSPSPTRREERLAFIRKALGMLSQRDRLLLLGYYFEENTMSQIGEQLDLSESRVSQLHSRLVEQLRERHQSREQELFELARAS